MTSTLLRKLMVAGAVVAALGVVACKPKPAADSSAAASDATAAASDAAAAASSAAAATAPSSAPAQ